MRDALRNHYADKIAAGQSFSTGYAAGIASVPKSKSNWAYDD